MQEFSLAIINDPEICEQKRLRPHADIKCYASVREALTSHESSLIQSLNGRWFFHYAQDIEHMPKGCEYEDYSFLEWGPIVVPGHLETQGYGTPVFIDTLRPWQGYEKAGRFDVPQKNNAVGTYVTFFNNNPEWTNYYICFEGVTAACAIFLNGHYVGYVAGSFTPCDFDISPYIREGQNRLVVRVFSYSSWSLLEERKRWHLSGLFRGVYMYTKPCVHLEDLYVNASLEDDYMTPCLNGSVRLSNDGALLLRLSDTFGNVVTTSVVAKANEDTPFTVDITSLDLLPWSAESPNLYNLVCSVMDANGEDCEASVLRIGFRRFEKKCGVLYLNGQRLIIKGVHRQEFSPTNGYSISDEEIRQDLLTLKRNNINAICTGNYPSVSAFYDYCDELGFYVISGALPLADAPESETEWLPEKLYKAVTMHVKAMVERDKNHPCVLLWSTNRVKSKEIEEILRGPSGHGISLHDFICAYKPDLFIKKACAAAKKDIVTPVAMASLTPAEVAQLNLTAANSNGAKALTKLSLSALQNKEKSHSKQGSQSFESSDMLDFKAKMQRLEVTATAVSCSETEEAERKVLFFWACSRTPCLNGAPLYDLMQQAYAQDQFQGGFIRDFRAPAMYVKNSFGQYFYSGGTDFDDNVSCGLAFADGAETSSLSEVRYCFQQYSLDVSEEGVTIKSHVLFSDTTDLDLHIRLLLNGSELSSYTTECLVRPGRTVTVPVRMALLDESIAVGEVEEDAEYVLQASLEVKEDLPWAHAGYELACGETILHTPEHFVLLSRTCEGLEFYKTEGFYGVVGPDFTLLFSQKEGSLVSYKRRGMEFLKGKLSPFFWHAATDMERQQNWAFQNAIWKSAGALASCVGHEAVMEKKWIHISFKLQLAVLPHEIFMWVNYYIYDSGQIRIETTIPDAVDGLPQKPLFGMRFPLRGRFRTLSYYGRGPQPNYDERKHGCKLALYDGSSTYEEFELYLRPQECGNHSDTRYAKLRDEEGHYMLVSCVDEPFNFSALPWSSAQLEEAQHPFELSDATDKTYIRLRPEAHSDKTTFKFVLQAIW